MRWFFLITMHTYCRVLYNRIIVMTGETMKLNADMVFDSLPHDLLPSMTGIKEQALLLHRPKLFESGDQELMANHLYVLTRERLPSRIEVRRGVVILCIGDTPKLDWYRNRCCVVTVRDDADFFSTFNVVQRIFDSHDAWEERLNEIASNGAGIQEMLDSSSEMLGNPMLVVDSQFAYLGLTRGPWTDYAELPQAKGLGASEMREFLREHDLAMSAERPFMLETHGVKTLCVNLLEDGTYLGCLIVAEDSRPFVPSDMPKAAYLADMVKRALKQLALTSGEGTGSLRGILQSLLLDQPIDAHERERLARSSQNEAFLCLRLRLGRRIGGMPLGFVCNAVEDAFPGGMAFSYKDASVIGVVETPQNDLEDLTAMLIERLSALIESSAVQIGVSSRMEGLLDVRTALVEATIALDQGSLLDPGKNLYLFQDYALVELISRPLDELPLERFFSPGLARLVRHDAASPVSYVETLRFYLNNNMSVTATAAVLYIHRSTLIERLDRIRKLLGEDLDDPDVRLRIEIVLRAMQLREQTDKAPD